MFKKINLMVFFNKNYRWWKLAEEDCRKMKQEELHCQPEVLWAQSMCAFCSVEVLLILKEENELCITPGSRCVNHSARNVCQQTEPSLLKALRILVDSIYPKLVQSPSISFWGVMQAPWTPLCRGQSRPGLPTSPHVYLVQKFGLSWLIEPCISEQY